jgi:actin related protein 2/3 complex subunit 1A/1B
VLIAAGSSDFTCRVFSGYVKTVDPKPPATCWGKKMPFGNMMAEFTTGSGGGGWVHDVSFTDDGEKLVFVAHDSSVTVVDGANEMAVSRSAVPMLPFRCVSWVTQNSFVACGHDNVPMLFEHKGADVKFIGPLDIPPAKKEVKVSAARSLPCVHVAILR